MKSRIDFWVCSILLVLSSAGCESSFDAESQLSDAPPRLHVRQTVVDLGEVMAGPENHVARFILTNRGGKEIKIRELALSCTCVDAKIERRTIPPSESVQLEVIVRSAISESKESGLTIVTNDPLQPKLQLTVRWRAIAAVEFQPHRLEFGGVRPGEVVRQRVKVIRRQSFGVDTTLSEITVPVGSRLSTLTGNRALNETSAFFEVELTAGKKLGEHREVLAGVFQYDNFQPLKLPVSWTVRDELETSPKALFFGHLSPGAKVRRKVLVSADKTESLEISATRLRLGNIDADLSSTKLTDSVMVVDLLVRAPESTGDYSDTLEIECVSKRRSTLLVPVSLVVSTE